MKKKKIPVVIPLMIIVIIVVIGILYIRNKNGKVSNEVTNEVVSTTNTVKNTTNTIEKNEQTGNTVKTEETEKKTEHVEFQSQDGSTTYSIDVENNNYVTGFGWAGASNNVFYIKDNCMYHKYLSDGREEKEIEGATKIWTDEDGLINVKVEKGYKILIEDNYIQIVE